MQGRTPQIQVTVAPTALLGADDHPAELAGYGPIGAHAARRLAADPTGTWRRIVTDPVSGHILDYGRSTYRPPQNLIDHVTARDRTCRFPGCTVPARRCDHDHVHPWDNGGTTNAGNLAALCRRHHRLKTEKIWTYHLDSNATATWTSPGGRHYSTRPPPLTAGAGSRAAALAAPPAPQPRYGAERPNSAVLWNGAAAPTSTAPPHTAGAPNTAGEPDSAAPPNSAAPPDSAGPP